MQKKGQTVVGVGMFITLFISIIVGVILLIATAQSVGETLNTGSYSTAAGDAALEVPANGVIVDLEGQDLIGAMTITHTNGSSYEGNYTVSEAISTSTGVKTIIYTQNTATSTGLDLNLTYTFGPDGYVEDTGARGVIGIIVVMFALAIAVIAMEPTLRSGIIDNI